MTPEQKLKALILSRAMDEENLERRPITAESISELWDELTDADMHWDYMSELRGGEVETGLDCPWSRHYESKAVAMKMPDGSWIGWTYWYGGGKHGEPEAIDWMDSAYELDCAEEQKMVTVRTFTVKTETASA